MSWTTIKKGLAIMGIIALIASLVGCTDKGPTLIDDFGIKGTDGIGPSAQTNTSGITHFSYGYNNSFRAGSYLYEASVGEDGSVTLSCELADHTDYGTMTTTADKDFIDQLQQLYADNKVAQWDGFDKYATHVLDGDGFSLSIKFADGSHMSAYGSNAVPSGYGAFVHQVDELFEPYVKAMCEQARQQKISQGTTGKLDSLMVNFAQNGTSGTDSYNFFITTSDVRDRNLDVTINSDGEFFPAGKHRYYSALPDQAIDFAAVQALIDKHGVINWYGWNETAEDYNNSEWFQMGFSYDDDFYLDAMGTKHPEGYDQFRAEFLQLMAKMIGEAQQNYGLQEYQP